jgi:hypothetical protein
VFTEEVVVMADKGVSPAPDAAQRRAEYLTALSWHIGVFIIINGFFWGLDLIVGEPGLQWAYWITLFWGFALAFHVLAYLIDGRGLTERKAAEYRRQAD